MRQVATTFTNLRFDVLLGLIMSCGLAGCWEEIEYTGPDPATAQTAPTPPDATSQAAEQSTEPAAPHTVASDDSNADASGFADELANSISSETTPPSEPVVASDPAEPPADTNFLPFETTENTQPREDTSSTSTVPETVSLPTGEETETSEQADTIPGIAEAAPVPTRLDAWLLGSHLSLAALANDRGLAPENVQKWLESAKLHAAALGVAVADLPAAAAGGSSQSTSREVLNYLFVQGQQIGRKLARRHGADHAALVEVALKSNLLRVLYSPGAGTTEAISGAIAQAAPRGNLPATLWQPLVDLLAAKADAAEVRKAVQSFHAEVERHLAPAAEQ
jgi:hypothetical protein